MIYIVYNLKGGEGKTRIAVNLALTMEYAYVTNDVYNRKIEKVFPKGKMMKIFPEGKLPEINSNEDLLVMDQMPDFDKNDDVVIDLGGYPDTRTTNNIKKAQCIIVPITYNEDDFDTAFGTLEEVSDYNKNIVIVANRTTGDEFEKIKKEVKKAGYSYPIFEIKKSNAVSKIIHRKEPIKETAKKSLKLFSSHYQKVAEQFDELINFITQ